MKKVIVMVRTSTEAQQVEDQHNEMVQFCMAHGYTEEQMIFVETQGASAVKMDDDYLDMIQRVKELILEDKEIECFAVWHLNRAVRNEKVFVDLKDFLIKHNVQFLVKNPYLKLLNEDGSINMGMELAFSLMATLAKQDNDERQAKFRRAKKAMREQGKYIGGPTVKFGYRVGEGGYIVIDDEDSKLVRLVFQLYSTGKYSVRSLYDELVERGYKINYHLINRMIADRIYVDGRYPQMISQELFDKCENIRKRNFISIPQGRRHCFGSAIFMCPVCGNRMIAEGVQYRCRHHNKYSAPPHCSNKLTIRVDNLDGLLWFVAGQEEVKYRYRMDANKKQEFTEKIEALREKVDTAKKKLAFIDEKRNRIAELYIDGLISKEEKEKRLSGTVKDVKEYNDTILKFEERIGALLTLMEGNDEYTITPEKIKSIYLGVVKEEDLVLMDEIVKRHIRAVTATATVFKGRKSAQVITIETVWSGEKKFIYVARKYGGHYFFTMDGKALRSIRKIVREPLGELNPRAFKKICYI